MAHKKSNSHIPGPRGLDLLRWGGEIQKKPLETFEKLHETFGDMVWCPWLRKSCLFVNNPDGIKHVLKDNHANYQKTNQIEELKPLLGQGLLTSNGNLWREQRKIMANQFHGAAIDSYMATLKDTVNTELSTLHEGEIDIDPFFSKLTLMIAGKIFFGSDVESFYHTISKNLAQEMHMIDENNANLFTIPYKIPSPRNLRRKKGIQKMNEVVTAIMKEDQADKNENVLSKLMRNGGISNKQIRDEVMTLLLAGHETTSNLLSWTIWLLSQNPEWQVAIYEELKKFKDIDSITRNDYKSLKILNSVIQESLRILPPVPGISRTSINKDEICGHPIEAGTTIVILPWVIHRDPRYWAEPNQFDPNRFLQASQLYSEFAFIPFAAGPRGCIGEDLAIAEASYILAKIVSLFSWEAQIGFKPQQVAHVTLRSQNGIRMILKKRKT